jgi:hypothetical protein
MGSARECRTLRVRHPKEVRVRVSATGAVLAKDALKKSIERPYVVRATYHCGPDIGALYRLQCKLNPEVVVSVQLKRPWIDTNPWSPLHLAFGLCGVHYGRHLTAPRNNLEL